jgi:hypothetical protein
MNVYQLRIDGDKSKVFGGGAALVAAPTFEAAKYEYICNGDWGEDVYCGDIVFTPSCDIPILGLNYEGGTQILVDAFFID